MKWLLAIGVLVGGFAAAILIASETGGEVVIVTTTDERGVSFETSLWIVEYKGSAYLRAGSRDSAWYERLVANPEIQMERRGETEPYTAHPDPAATPAINRLMAEEYGMADRLISLIRDGDRSVAVRLARVKTRSVF